MRFRAVMVVGNKKGKVGIGVSKGLDVSQAIEKATTEYRKYQVQAIAPVEQEYLDTIKRLEKEAKSKSKE